MSAGSLAKFRGMCVGGPADGVMRDADANWFLAVRIKNKLVAFGPGDPMPETTPSNADKYRYEHVEMTAMGISFGFWVGKGANHAYIMRQLVTSYERKEGKY